MSSWFKVGFVAFFFHLFFQAGIAQNLEYLPPVLCVNRHTDTTCLLLNTLDFSRDENQKGKKPYTHSIQIVDANEPWPPRWYMATPVYTDEMFKKDMETRNRTMNFYENPEINGDYIYYLQIYPLNKILDQTKTFDVQHSAILGVLDNNLNLVDSITCGRYRGGNYGNDFFGNKEIEILTIQRRDSLIDWRSLSGNEADGSIESEFAEIRVVDINGNIKFIWNPLKYLNHDLFRTKEKLAQLPQEPNGKLREIRWLKISSIAWDYDGNILYGIEDVGIGKISRKDGHIIWQINYTDVPYIPQQSILGCYSPYDFKLISHNKTKAYYSFYERGMFGNVNGRGVVFELDKKANQLKLIKYINGKIEYWSSGHGGFDYNLSNGEYVLDYGVYSHLEAVENSDFWNGFEYGKGDSVYSVYQIPKWNYMFGVHRLDNFPKPPRPIIVKNGDRLQAQGEMKEWAWYKFDSNDYTNLIPVGVGAWILFEKNTVYCVAGKYGAGYCVSKAFKAD